MSVIFTNMVTDKESNKTDNTDKADVELKSIIDRLESEGYELSTDYEVIKGRIKGKDFKIVIEAPDASTWMQLQAAAEVSSKGVQNAKIWDESQKCVLYPSRDVLKDICDKKPATKMLVTNTVGKLATAGLGFLRD